MKIYIFSGTTEGRTLSERLSLNKYRHTVFVATDTGRLAMEENEYANILVGRMDEADMIKLFEEDAPDMVIDATHPYAVLVSENLRNASEKTKTKYVRILRADEEKTGNTNSNKNIIYYDDAEDCAKGLTKTKGNILFTTGSKELKALINSDEVRNRVYVRVLPAIESIKLCNEAGILEKNIIAMYGPHTKECNQAIISQYEIKHLVTKDSGKTGGFAQKVDAAIENNCMVHIIKRPKEQIEDSESVMSMDDIMLTIFGEISEDTEEKLTESKIMSTTNGLDITIKLLGIGPGDEKYLPTISKEALKTADIIFGAKRMVEKYQVSHKVVPVYTADKIIPELEKMKSGNAVVLFSGDTGFCSGASKLYEALKKWNRCNSIEILPGLSSYVVFASLLGVDYTNAALLSLHGKSKDGKVISDIENKLSVYKEAFVLMSGIEDFPKLYEIMKRVCLKKDLSLKEVSVDIGYNLTLENQQIYHTNAADMLNEIKLMSDGLYIIRLCEDVNE